MIKGLQKLVIIPWFVLICFRCLSAQHYDKWVRMLCRMSEYRIRSSDELVSFGQLYGMCDQVSFSLGKSSPYAADVWSEYTGPIHIKITFLITNKDVAMPCVDVYAAVRLHSAHCNCLNRPAHDPLVLPNISIIVSFRPQMTLAFKLKIGIPVTHICGMTTFFVLELKTKRTDG